MLYARHHHEPMRDFGDRNIGGGTAELNSVLHHPVDCDDRESGSRGVEQ